MRETLLAVFLLTATTAGAQEPPPPQLAHFHHVHLNVTDPKAAIDFYTSKFDCEKSKFAEQLDAVWAQKSWLLFTKVNTPPKSEITSTIWHIGWGAENMKETYQKQLDNGTKFATPITDISDIGGGTAQGVFFYAYVDGPDHQLIELNTANHHHFGHIHMLSKDPVAAGEWYVKEFGLQRRGRGTPSREPRMYHGYQIGPSSSLMMDNVNIIIFPWQYAQKEWPDLWKDRTEFESTKGHVTDHIGFSVDNLDETLARLKKDGVKVTDEPRTVLGGKLKIAFIEGPDKIRIELVEQASTPVSAASEAVAAPVRITTGLISGTPGANPDVRVYKGIPYAAPPIGGRRWKAPQSPSSWTGTREAKEFSAPCMQVPYPQTSIYYSPLPAVSEDCLYLNVWTAATSAAERRPVMVWIHGGGYTRGSGATPTYNGENLAKKGAVVVTINYRLGIFGFLAHPELTKESDVHSSGNYGLLDMVKALEWVQKNIAAFGGDPNRVTIFGESAGSSAVNFLMASPLAKGLFHRVIGESGANFGRRLPLAEAEQNGSRLGTLAALRAKSAEDLLTIEGSFRPDVDGWFLPEDVSSIFAHGRQSDVPLIAGYNHDEARTLAPLPPGATAKTFVDQARKRFGAFAGEFLKLYPASTDEQAADAHYDSSRDQGMGWEMRTWVRSQTQSGKAPAYLYYFTRVPPGPTSERYRAYHAAEIQYVFGNFRAGHSWEEADHKLSVSSMALAVAPWRKELPLEINLPSAVMGPRDLAPLRRAASR